MDFSRAPSPNYFFLTPTDPAFSGKPPCLVSSSHDERAVPRRETSRGLQPSITRKDHNTYTLYARPPYTYLESGATAGEEQCAEAFIGPTSQLPQSSDEETCTLIPSDSASASACRTSWELRLGKRASVEDPCN